MGKDITAYCPDCYKPRDIVQCKSCGTGKKPNGEWIKVDEKLPEDCESVIIWKKSMDPISAFLVFDRQGKPIGWHINDWDESEYAFGWREVTHWMPLPEPPKDENIEQGFKI